MNMPPPPLGSKVNDQYRVEPPKRLREVPKYLKRVVGDTSARMFYIVKLVWEANRGIMFMMAFMTLFNGIMPVTGSLISKEILNNLAKAYGNELTNFHIIAVLLIAQFVYLLFNDAMTRIYSTVLHISGELVANHIKIKLMTKSKEVDLSSYDSPEYYTKLENATREAARRPIESLTATFSILSTLLSIVSYIIVILAVGILPALAIIAVAIPSTVINFHFRRKNFAYMFWRSKERRQLSYYSELVTNKDLVKEMRTLNLTDTFIAKYKKVFGAYFQGLRKLMVQECGWNLGAGILSTVVNLDEPTASLDAIAEQEIFTQFETLRQGKSSIFVSHRLSSATTANTIVVLNNGTIEEIGNHSELMKLHGEYYKLFSTQARRYHAPIEDEMPPSPMRPRPDDRASSEETDSTDYCR